MLKKGLLSILILLNVLLLSSCSKNTIDEPENPELTNLVLSKGGYEINNTYLVQLYFKNNSYSHGIYECSYSFSSDSFIAGYFTNDTMKFLDSLKKTEDLVHPLHISWYASGINGYLYLYQLANHYKLIDIEKHNIIFKSYNTNEIPMKYNASSLAFVLEKGSLEAVSLVDNKKTITNLYSNVEFSINKNVCIVNRTSNLPQAFLISAEELETGYFVEQLKKSSVEIKEYEGVKCIYEPCGAILGMNYKEEYYDVVKDYIISPNTSLEMDEIFIYDYEKIKDIFSR